MIVEVETVEIDFATVERMADAEDSIGDTEKDLSEEHHAVVEQL